jgi:hypothetical protein
MMTKPRISTLTSFGFQVNSAISNGHPDALSFDEIYRSLEAGTLLQDLERKLPEEFDLGLIAAQTEQAVALNEALNEVALGLKGRELRKLGVEKSGLHLLLAFILEAIQRQYWVLPAAESEPEEWLEANEAKKGPSRLPS